MSNDTDGIISTDHGRRFGYGVLLPVQVQPMQTQSAKPGWQLYILHTVGFQRNCPENKYWDYGQGKEVIPIAYEMAKPFAVAIVEVK